MGFLQEDLKLLVICLSTLILPASFRSCLAAISQILFALQRVNLYIFRILCMRKPSRTKRKVWSKMSKSLNILLFAILCFTASGNAVAQQDIGESREYTAQKITDTLYVLNGTLGYGPNVGLSIGATRALIIDGPRRETTRPELLEAIRKITDLPIEYSIVPDGDYHLRDRALFFEEIGAQIIAQNNAHYGYTPSQIRFKDKLSLTLTDEYIDLYHVIVNAHDDIIIHFPSSNVIFVGNLYDANGLPAFFVGGIAGMEAAMDLVALLSDERTVIVPRYGNMVTSQTLQDYLNNSKALVQRLHTLFANDVSPQDMAVDEQFLRSVEKFTGPTHPDQRRISRLIERVISSEFVMPFAIAEPKIQSYLGKYKLEDGQTIELIREGEKIYARQEGQFLLELVPVSNTEFHVRGGLGDKLTILHEQKPSRVSGLKLSLYGETIKAIRKR